jgi:hypothetical protein
MPLGFGKSGLVQTLQEQNLPLHWSALAVAYGIRARRQESSRRSVQVTKSERRTIPGEAKRGRVSS